MEVWLYAIYGFHHCYLNNGELTNTVNCSKDEVMNLEPQKQRETNQIKISAIDKFETATQL